MKVKKSIPNKSVKLVIEHRSAGLVMARSLLRKWGVFIEAEELRSLTDLALCETALRFKSDRGAQFQTLLYFHLKHALVQTIKERTKFSRYQGSDIQEHENLILSEHSPEDLILADEAKEQCHEVMGKLLPFEYKVINEVVIQGEKVAKLARSIGYSRGHLSDIKTVALQKMREQLTPYKEAA